ncbi:hypothetical protein PG994_006902 [Apiospora phragmitis]|uniref:Nuclear protein MDM1 n=1 Tax=Apiospora phragmitis TaxID=2905665 RepID=A0ABR1VGC5_9PEZI
MKRAKFLKNSASDRTTKTALCPSFFHRLAFFKRQPKGEQFDYRERWPTVTTLVEQRSELGFFNKDQKQPPNNKPAKVKALETASVPLRWLHHRLESVQDHLDHSIEIAEARALKRASLPEKPTKPGESNHPYDTGVETHTSREYATEDRVGESTSTGTVLKFETNITSKASPPPSSLNKWRIPFTGHGRQPTAESQRPASEQSNAGTDEEITAGLVPQSQWKSTKDRRPSKYPDRKKSLAVGTSVPRPSSGGGKKAGISHATVTSKPSPEPSLKQHRKHAHPRRESVDSRGRPTSSKMSSSTKTLTPSQSSEPTAAAPQQTARRLSISSQLAQAVGLLSPQSHSRTTSANRGMEHAQSPTQEQPQKKRGGRKPSAASRTPAGSNSAKNTPQDQQDDPMGGAAAAAFAVTAATPTSSADASPNSAKSPKSGAFRHLLDVVKGGVPPSRAVSPLSMNGD